MSNEDLNSIRVKLGNLAEKVAYLREKQMQNEEVLKRIDRRLESIAYGIFRLSISTPSNPLIEQQIIKFSMQAQNHFNKNK